MNICFYNNHPYWGGLANNGGSRTILKSCEALRKLGHHTCVVAPVDYFTWFKHDAPVKKIPKDTDLAIAVSISDIELMLDRLPDHVMAAYWARPFETWQMSEKKCLKAMRLLDDFGGKVICNSQWQTDFLRKNDIEATTVYAGMDFDQWQPPHRRDSTSTTVGFLVHSHPRKRFKDTRKLIKLVSRTSANVQWVGFGDLSTINRKELGGLRCDQSNFRFFESPSHDTLLKIYQQCHYFFAPTEFEGFHNPPAEAALCGCGIICMDHPRNGCMDYCNIRSTSVERVASLLSNPHHHGINITPMLNLHNKVGSRERNMQKLVEVLS